MTERVDADTRANRISLQDTAPGVIGAMAAFGRAAEEKLAPVVAELVKIRASQLNGCAYCLDMHTREALAAGESERRLHALPAWRHSPFFTPRERAALAFAEAVTLVADSRVSDDVYELAARHFSATELAHLLWTIAAINAWNRVAIAARLVPAAG